MAWAIPASSRNKATGSSRKVLAKGSSLRSSAQAATYQALRRKRPRAASGRIGGIGGCKLVILLSRIGRGLFRPPRLGTTSLLPGGFFNRPEKIRSASLILHGCEAR